MDTALEPPAKNMLTLLDNGIICITQTGHQTLESLNEFKPQVDKYTKDRHAAGKKALILVNVVGVTGHDASAREKKDELFEGDYDATAIFGQTAPTGMIINWAVKVIGKSDKVRFFNSEAEATAWLLTHNQ